MHCFSLLLRTGHPGNLGEYGRGAGGPWGDCAPSPGQSPVGPCLPERQFHETRRSCGKGSWWLANPALTHSQPLCPSLSLFYSHPFLLWTGSHRIASLWCEMIFPQNRIWFELL